MSESYLEFFPSTIPKQYQFLFQKDVKVSKLYEMLLKILDQLTSRPNISNNIVHNSALLTGMIEIGHNTIIDPEVVMEGPVKIGDSCYIEHLAKIGPHTLICNNSRIGHAVTLRRAVVFENVQIYSFSQLEDIFVGGGTIIEYGVKTRSKQKFLNGDSPSPLVIGEYSSVGSNAQLAQNAKIGHHSTLAPLSVISSYLEPYSNINPEP